MRPEAFTEPGLMRDVIFVGVEGVVISVSRERAVREPGSVLYALNIARGRVPAPPELRGGILWPKRERKTRSEFIAEILDKAPDGELRNEPFGSWFWGDDDRATSGVGWPD